MGSQRNIEFPLPGSIFNTQKIKYKKQGPTE